LNTRVTVTRLAALRSVTQSSPLLECGVLLGRKAPCGCGVMEIRVVVHTMTPMPFDRVERAKRLRDRAAAMRGDAGYWRRRGHRGTAAELARVAAFIARLADDLAPPKGEVR
jgi:hypothetical protein